MSLGVGGFEDGGDEEPWPEDDGIDSICGVPTLDVDPYPREGTGWTGAP